MIWTDPVPTLAELEEFYGEEVPDAGLDEWLLQDYFPLDFYRRRLATMARYQPPGRRVLDVGVGFGHFMRAAREAVGADRGGPQPPGGALCDGAARPPRRHRRRAPYVRRTRSFDAIHAKDVIEHITDPVEELKAYRAMLPPGGLLVIETLNIGSVYRPRPRANITAPSSPATSSFSAPHPPRRRGKAGFEFLRCWGGDEDPIAQYWKRLPPKSGAGPHRQETAPGAALHGELRPLRSRPPEFSVSRHEDDFAARAAGLSLSVGRGRRPPRDTSGRCGAGAGRGFQSRASAIPKRPRPAVLSRNRVLTPRRVSSRR